MELPLIPSCLLLESSLEGELRSQNPLVLAGLCSVFLQVPPPHSWGVPEGQRGLQKFFMLAEASLISQGCDKSASVLFLALVLLPLTLQLRGP